MFKRGTILFTDGILKCERIYNIKDEVKTKIDWAISGIMLYPSYNPVLEGFTKPYDDVLRATSHTAIGFKGNKVYLIASDKSLSMKAFRDGLLNSRIAFDGLIALDGGGSTQLNYGGAGIKSNRKVGSIISIKEK